MGCQPVMSKHQRWMTPYQGHPSLWLIFHQLHHVLNLTLSTPFSRVLLRLALLIITLQSIWWWGMSLSKREGQRYMSKRRNGPLSTSWNALIISLTTPNQSWIGYWVSLPCLHRPQAPQGSRPIHQPRRGVCKADEWLYYQDFLDWVGD